MYHLTWMKQLSQTILKNNYSQTNIPIMPSLCIYIFQKMFQRCLHPIQNTITTKQLRLPTDLVVTNNSKLQVTVHDVLSLANYTYLNDIVINYILETHHKETDRPDIYLLDSLFFTSLTHHPSLAANWTKTPISSLITR